MDPANPRTVEWREKTMDFRKGKKATPPMDPGPKAEKLPLRSHAFLDNLLRLNLVGPHSVAQFLNTNAERLSQFDSAEVFGDALVQTGMLTQYQLDRIMAGTTHGLVLGQYRVLDRIGSGGMGIVFMGEHTLMERRVAIKVLPVDDDCPAVPLERFYNEARVLAKLQHPNIVMAFDFGRVAPPPGLPSLLYLVMELVQGCDLEKHLQQKGPPSISKACNWICQAACGLQEAHNHNLVHRDVKPSNLLLTRDEQIKLVDFGLVRQLSVRLTDPRTVLGTLDFMPPEQGADPTSVGTHADIYSLGATLFWLLTGQSPYPPTASFKEALEQLQQNSPRRLRALRPDAPPELEAILVRLLERDPMRRPSMAHIVMKQLQPFIGS